MGIALSTVGVGVLAGPAARRSTGRLVRAPRAVPARAAVAIADAITRLTLLPTQQSGELAARAPAIRRRPELLRIVALTGLGAAVIAFLEPILPLHARDALGLERTTIGLLFGAGALTAAVGPPLIGLALRSIPPQRLAAAGAALTAAGLATAALADNAWLLAALALIGVGAAGLLTPTLTMIADLADRDRPPAYGALYALCNLAYAAGLGRRSAPRRTPRSGHQLHHRDAHRRRCHRSQRCCAPASGVEGQAIPAHLTAARRGMPTAIPFTDPSGGRRSRLLLVVRSGRRCGRSTSARSGSLRG